MGIFGESKRRYEAEQRRLNMAHGRPTAIICEQINSYVVPKQSHIIYLFKKTAAANDACWNCFKTSVCRMVKTVTKKDIVAWDEFTLAQAVYTLSLIDAQIEFIAADQPAKAALMRSAWTAAMQESSADYKPLSLDEAESRLESAEAPSSKEQRGLKSRPAEPTQATASNKPAKKGGGKKPAVDLRIVQEKRRGGRQRAMAS